MTTQYEVAGSMISSREAAIYAAIESWAGSTPASEWTEDQIREHLPGWCKAPEGVDQVKLDAEVVQTAIVTMLKGHKKMACYMVMTGKGDILCDGVPWYSVEDVAQELADDLAETVYYLESGTDLDSDDEDEGVAVRPRTVRCQCGRYTGERCTWVGPRDETVVVEYMPKDLRASHEAARNAGVYPHNGAIRIRCEISCAESIVENDADWARIVG